MISYEHRYTHSAMTYWTGLAFANWARRAARRNGVLATAKRLRKQGIGLQLAIAVLARRP